MLSRAWRPPPPVRRELPPPRVINVSYAVKRPHTVLATPTGSIVVPGTSGRAGPEARAAETAAGLRAAAAAVALSRPVLSVVDLEARTDAGVVTSQHEMQSRRLMEQAARLVAVLPLFAVAHAAGCAVHDLAGLGADRLAHHLVVRRPGNWKWATVKDMHNVLVRWLAWLQRHDVEHDGSTYSAVDLGDFFEEVDANARAKEGAAVRDEIDELRHALQQERLLRAESAAARRSEGGGGPAVAALEESSARHQGALSAQETRLGAAEAAVTRQAAELATIKDAATRHAESQRAATAAQAARTAEEVTPLREALMTARELAEQRHAHQARQEGALRHAAEEGREGHGRLAATCEGLAERLRAVEAERHRSLEAGGKAGRWTEQERRAEPEELGRLQARPCTRCTRCTRCTCCNPSAPLCTLCTPSTPRAPHTMHLRLVRLAAGAPRRGRGGDEGRPRRDAHA